MGNGQWTMDGQWMDNGQWTMDNGQWTNGQMDKWTNGQMDKWAMDKRTMDNEQMDNGQWTMDNGQMDKWTKPIVQILPSVFHFGERSAKEVFLDQASVVNPLIINLCRSLFYDKDPSSNPILSHPKVLELFNHTSTFSSFSGSAH
jgi:hypothetical protein